MKLLSNNFEIQEITKEWRARKCTIIENIVKITKSVEFNGHVNTVSSNIAQKIVWKHLNKAGPRATPPKLVCRVLMHPTYSPALASSDY